MDPSHNSFWEEIGGENVLPKYVQNFLVFNGFDDALVFGDIDDTLLDAMEKAYRKKLPSILLKVAAAQEAEYCPRFMVPNEFELRIGHRLILLKLVEMFKSSRTVASGSVVDQHQQEPLEPQIKRIKTETDAGAADAKHEPVTAVVAPTIEEFISTMDTTHLATIYNRALAANAEIPPSTTVSESQFDVNIPDILCNYCEKRFKLVLQPGRTVNSKHRISPSNYVRHLKTHFNTKADPLQIAFTPSESLELTLDEHDNHVSE